MIPRSRIEATMRFLGLDPMQALNHERQRDALKLKLRRERATPNESHHP